MSTKPLKMVGPMTIQWTKTGIQVTNFYLIDGKRKMVVGRPVIDEITLSEAEVAAIAAIPGLEQEALIKASS